MSTRYTLLEILFANRWQWVRKLSKERWMRPKQSEYTWIKMDAHFEHFSKVLNVDTQKYQTHPDFIFEDWR